MSDDLSERETSRTQLCEAISAVLALSNPSSELLNSLVNSVLSTYDAGEVTGDNRTVCYDALTSLTSWVADGFLVGSDSSLGSSLISAVSSFFEANTTSSSIDISGTVSNITKGLLMTMAHGQTAVNYASDNVRISLIRDTITSFGESSYSPPQTDSELSYGSLKPSISFANNDSAASCDDGYGYVRMSIVGFGTNPYVDSTDTKAPIFRTQTYPDTSSSNRRRMRRRLTNATGSYTDNSRTEYLDFTPVYFLTLQFSSVQDFNFSVDSSTAQDANSNTTFPLCRLFDGSNYIPCSTCNISSYNNHNVTYGCSDIAQICGSPSTDDRRSLLTEYDQDFIESYHQNVARGRDPSVEYLSRRSLFSLSGDDDGTYTDSGTGTLSQFSTILSNVDAEISDVFSLNIFTINVDAAKPVLIVVGLIFFLFFFGFLYFVRWDRLDHHMLMYTKSDKDKKAHDKARVKMIMYAKEAPTSKRKNLISYLTTNRRLFSKNKYGVIDEVLKAEEAKAKLIMRQQTLQYEELEDLELHIESEVSTFLHMVMPSDHKILKNKQFAFANALLSEHEYINMFSFASVHRSRVSRWINICMSVMICIFLDSIFFGQFYGDRGECENNVNDEQGCKNLWNKASNRHTCEWIASTDVDAAVGAGTCSMLSPPSSVVFTVIIMALTIIVGVPLNLLYSVLTAEVCSRRPDFERIGWTSNFWLNSQSQRLLQGTTAFTSGLQAVFQEAEDIRHEEVFEGVETKKHKEAMLKRNLHEINVNALRIYNSTVSTVEEVDQIYSEVAAFVEKYSKRTEIPWKSTSATFAAQKAKAVAIAKNFNVDIAGKNVGLSLRQYFTYGTQRNRLEAKIDHIRHQVQHVVKALEEVGEPGSNDRDIALIQFFVLEQFSVYKRYALRYQFFYFDASTPRLIHPFIWLAGWLFVFCSFGFFLYWVLAWAVLNGSSTFKSWGINFCLSVMQDVLIIQVAKVYVLFVLAMYSIRPQLNFIYRTLTKLAVDFIQEGSPLVSQSRDVRVVQHMSPACRAARLNISHGLASATILNQMDDMDWQNCRTKSTRRMVSVAFMLLLFPAVVSLFHVLAGELVLETIIPTIFTGFLLANYYVSVRSVGALVAVYMILFAFFLWRFYLIKPASKNVKKIAKKAKNGNFDPHKDSRDAWYASKRTRNSQSFKKFTKFCIHSFYFGMYRLVRWLLTPIVMVKKQVVRATKDDTMWKNMNVFATVGSTPTCDEVVIPRRLLSKILSQQKNSPRIASGKYSPISVKLSPKSNSSSSSPVNRSSSSSPRAAGSVRPTDKVWKIHKSVYDQGALDNHDGKLLRVGHVIPDVITALRAHGNDWKPEKKIPDQSGYVTKLLEKHLLDFDYDHRVVAPPSPTANSNITLTRHQGLPSLTYRDTYSISKSPEEALSRLVKKKLFTTSTDSGIVNMKIENTILSLNVQNGNKDDELIHYKVLNSIMDEIFLIYYPASKQIEAEALEEVLQLYVDWLTAERLKVSGKEEIQFLLFKNWFLELCDLLTRCSETNL